MQFLEQNLQTILMQKQSFQMDLSETISALKEIKDSKEDVYKVIGQLMIKVSKEKIEEDLKNKEKILNAKLKTLDEQEGNLTVQANKLRDELMNSFNNKK